MWCGATLALSRPVKITAARSDASRARVEFDSPVRFHYSGPPTYRFQNPPLLWVELGWVAYGQLYMHCARLGVGDSGMAASNKKLSCLPADNELGHETVCTFEFKCIDAKKEIQCLASPTSTFFHSASYLLGLRSLVPHSLRFFKESRSVC